MKKYLYVIHDKDLDDMECIVVGVADSLENVELMIDEYYGKHTVVKYTDIRDSNLEYSKIIETKDCTNNKTYRSKITIENFVLNEV